MERISRRTFTKAAAAAIVAAPITNKSYAQTQKSLRLGGPVPAKDPESWIKTLKALGYRAAYCPVNSNASDQMVNDYKNAARKADIVIAEVGAWSNPISVNDKMRNDAIKKCVDQLALADRIEANCCVNISGSRNPEKWAGPHKDNLTKDTFDLIVETTRKIIDEVKPTRTFFTLETMPWAYPDTVQSYVRLLKAIDRKQFAVHFDPVNLVVSPKVYFNTDKMIRHAFETLGPHIRSCHAKDIILDDEIYTPHLSEIQPGLGALDYSEMLIQLSKRPDIPLMMEHLKGQEEYKTAADYIRKIGKQNRLSFG